MIALAWPNDENDFNDPQWEISMDAYERLSNTTDAKGRKLTIVKVPCPPAIFRTYKEAGGLLVRGAPRAQRGSAVPCRVGAAAGGPMPTPEAGCNSCCTPPSPSRQPHPNPPPPPPPPPPDTG